MITPLVEFFSDPLRLTLLIVGLFVLVLVYFFSRRPKLKATSLAQENVAVHPADYANLPEERGTVGEVKVRKATDDEKSPLDERPKKDEVWRADVPEADLEIPAMLINDDAPKTPKAESKKKTVRVAEPIIDDSVYDDDLAVAAPPQQQAVEAEVKTEIKADALLDVAVEPEPQTAASAPSINQDSKVIVIILKSNPGRPFTGRTFVNVMQEANMQLDERGIFNLYGKDQGQAYVSFSAANLQEPGVFDLSDMDNFATPGLAFYMQVPMPSGNASLAFTQMMSTSQRIAKRLGGDLLTEQQKPLSVSEINALRSDVEKSM
jgi:cell division protein ZipA